ncbi:hypothetical protein MSG28_010802 [Choristoneura fumiferana]|uniref:Uncharacterized protein n=1 Tax=Choristoneura fumiferana TaxID=7141 RepID=A0ACC0KQ65_CHOFU|nr:hypothetical protein MSG28_010802 [Choristoneura fumiferana]
MSRNVAETARKFLLMGQCVPAVKQNAAKIRVKRLELDENLLMALPQKLTKLITHEVKEVVYPFGDVTDPVTGKKVAKERYREDIDRDVELYGKLKSTFDYKKAPP